LRKLFIPTAVIGGFLILGLDSEGQLPAHLVTLMSASLLLGEHLPPVRKIWRLSGAHVIMISVMVALNHSRGCRDWLERVRDGRRKRLQLSANHYASHPRRWLRDGARRAADRSLWAASLTIAAAAISAALIAWGIKRAGHGAGS